MVGKAFPKQMVLGCVRSRLSRSQREQVSNTCLPSVSAASPCLLRHKMKSSPHVALVLLFVTEAAQRLLLRQCWEPCPMSVRGSLASSWPVVQIC